MSNIHIILQGKGGVGKSVTAAFIAQIFNDKEGGLLCFDTDPVNTTFANYEEFQVETCDIMENGNINPVLFDHLITSLLETDVENVVIDNGASTFIPLLNYLETNDVFNLLMETGNRVIVHSIVTGGQAMMDTLAGLKQLCENFGDSGVRIVVWKNEFWGQISLNGKPFEESKVYLNNEKVIDKIITIPLLKPIQTFQDTFTEMLKYKMTFDQGINSDSFTLMERQRLKIIKNQIFPNIKSALNSLFKQIH